MSEFNSPENTNDPSLSSGETRMPSSTNKTGSSPFLSDLTDGRKPGNWATRYSDDEARKSIDFEKRYLLILIFLNIVIATVLGLLIKYPPYSQYCPTLRKYAFAFLGGAMGGSVFSAKWLVHSVAKNTWNRDRRLWRIFTPIVSGVLGFIVILLIGCGVISISNLDSIDLGKCYGVAFLIGYFSDNAIGKLTEIAQVFFGSSNNK